jgi:hypothetical protein
MVLTGAAVVTGAAVLTGAAVTGAEEIEVGTPYVALADGAAPVMVVRVLPVE